MNLVMDHSLSWPFQVISPLFEHSWSSPADSCRHNVPLVLWVGTSARPINKAWEVIICSTILVLLLKLVLPC